MTTSMEGTTTVSTTAKTALTDAQRITRLEDAVLHLAVVVQHYTTKLGNMGPADQERAALALEHAIAIENERTPEEG
jgi:hypothetical protein